MKTYDSVDKYLEEKKNKDYWINVVVEEEPYSYIIMSLRHKVIGRREDGIFLIHFFNKLADCHHSVHLDGTSHTKIRGNKKDKGKPLMEHKLPNLLTVDRPIQIFSGAINLYKVREYYNESPIRNINRYCKHPDQVITINRKYSEPDSLLFSVFVLPKGISDVPSIHFGNPKIFVFNLLTPPIAIVLGYEALPMNRLNDEEYKVYKRIEFVRQISNPDKLWAEFEPKLSKDGRKLKIPQWTFICKNKKYSMPALELELKENGRLIIGAFNGEDYYHYDLIGASIEPFDRNGPIAPTILWTQEDTVYVLRHIKEG